MYVYPPGSGSLPYDFDHDVRAMTIYQKSFDMVPLQNKCPVGYTSRMGTGNVIESNVIWSQAFDDCNANNNCCGVMQSTDVDWRASHSGTYDLVGCAIRENQTWISTCVKDQKNKDVCNTIALGNPTPLTWVKMGVGKCK